MRHIFTFLFLTLSLILTACGSSQAPASSDTMAAAQGAVDAKPDQPVQEGASKPAVQEEVAKPAAQTAAKPAKGDWNDAAIKWMDYDEGVALAKSEGKQVVLVFYTGWCPHCHNYARVFHDPKVVERSAGFVMIRVDNDKRKDLTAKHSPDGAYIPRTYFLGSDGDLRTDLVGRNPRYKYFLSEHNAGDLLGLMDKALAKKG